MEKDLTDTEAMSFYHNTEFKIYAKQQEALAQLSMSALQKKSDLLNQAVETISNILNIDFCTIIKFNSDKQVIEILAKNESFHLDNYTDKLNELLLETDSIEFYTLLNKETIIIENILTDNRFKYSSLVKSQAFISGLNVIIKNQNNLICGLISLYTKEKHIFSQSEIDFLTKISEIIGYAEKFMVKDTINDINDKILMDQASDSIFISSSDGKFVEVNQKACDFLGYSKEELLNMYIHDLISKEVIEKAPIRLDELNNGKKLTTEREFIRKDGDIVYAELTSNKLKDGKLMAIARDITAKKKIEETASKKTRELKTILENVPDIVTRIDRNLKYLYVNPAILLTSEQSVEYFIGKSHYDFLPKEKAQFIESKLKEVFNTGKEVIFEYNYDSPGGEVWFHSHCVPEFSETTNEIESVLTIARNITELKKTETIIRESEYRYKMLMDQASDAIFITDGSGNFLEINSKACDMLGYTKEEILNFNSKMLRNEEQSPVSIDLLKQGKAIIFERKLLCKNNHFIDTEISVKMLENGHFQSIVRDISGRKKAEDIIYKQEQEFKALVENTPDIIARFDQKLRFIYINYASEKMSGLPVNYFIGKTHREVGMPDELVLQWEEAIKKVFQTGEENTVEFPLIGNITNKHFQTRIVPEFSKEGNIEIVLCVSRDITTHKDLEQHLKMSLKEKEILLKEIHHRVKNNLQIISSLLSLQSNYIKSPEALEMFKDSQNRIRTMSYIHEKLYQSQNLASIDFSEYIHDLVFSLFKIYKINPENINLNLNINKLILDIDIAIPCGLIVNEVISNSLKYAFEEAQKGEIAVKIDIQETQFILIIGDNGIGLPENFSFENINTLGLQLVKMLCDQISATITINRENGTEFIITIPNLQT